MIPGWFCLRRRLKRVRRCMEKMRSSTQQSKFCQDSIGSWQDAMIREIPSAGWLSLPKEDLTSAQKSGSESSGNSELVGAFLGTSAIFPTSQASPKHDCCRSQIWWPTPCLCCMNGATRRSSTSSFIGLISAMALCMDFDMFALPLQLLHAIVRLATTGTIRIDLVLGYKSTAIWTFGTHSAFPPCYN